MRITPHARRGGGVAAAAARGSARRREALRPRQALHRPHGTSGEGTRQATRALSDLCSPSLPTPLRRDARRGCENACSAGGRAREGAPPQQRRRARLEVLKRNLPVISASIKRQRESLTNRIRTVPLRLPPLSHTALSAALRQTRVFRVSIAAISSARNRDPVLAALRS